MHRHLFVVDFAVRDFLAHKRVLTGLNSNSLKMRAFARRKRNFSQLFL
jgi:hypothetical protein